MDLGNFTIGENEINAGSLNIPLIKGDKGDRGQKGDTGATGYSPVRGVDYWTSEDQETIISEVESDLEDELDAKVDKVAGKGLSTEDFTTAEKTKLGGIESGAEVNVVETVKVNGTALTPSNKEVNIPVPTVTSDLGNDSNFVNEEQMNTAIELESLAREYHDGVLNTAIEEISDSLANYVQFTDYASNNPAGVIKTSSNYGTSVSNSGILQATVKEYSNYTSGYNAMFISKGTLENVITGKGLVSNTDYATGSVGGVIKSGNGFSVSSNGYLTATTYSYADYGTKANTIFIGKGTLENVLAEKIGSIETILEELDVRRWY